MPIQQLRQNQETPGMVVPNEPTLHGVVLKKIHGFFPKATVDASTPLARFLRNEPNFVLFESLDSTAITYGLRGEGGLSVGHPGSAIRRVLEAADIEFIDENGGGAGLRLRNRQRPKHSK
jgi:hypothetical protein